MFDIGMTELLVIGVVALIVVGPKDLPGMFRTLGRFTGKMKGMAREFSRAMNDAADEAGVKDVSDTLKSATSPSKMGLDRLNDAVDKFEKWTPGKSAKTTNAEGAEAPEVVGATSKGPETQKLSEERAEAAKKIHDMTAKRAAEKAAAEAATDAAPTLAPAPKPKPKPEAKAEPKAAKPKAPKPKVKPKTKPAAAKPASAEKDTDKGA